MENQHFAWKKISEHITRIRGIAKELMYLVEGEEKAVLIDTGIGVGNIRKLTEELTHKPVTVLLSHGHADHALGAGLFSEVYMSPLDKPIYKESSRDCHRKEFFEETITDWRTRIKKEDCIEQPVTNFCPLTDGQRFPLGGITVEALAFPGHTPGSMAFLFPEERAVFFGDACSFFTFVYDQDALYISEYLESLRRIQGRIKGRYDKIYTSHSGGEEAEDLLESAIAVVEDILAGNTDDEPFTFVGEKVWIAKKVDSHKRRIDKGSANIVYSREKVRKEIVKEKVRKEIVKEKVRKETAKETDK